MQLDAIYEELLVLSSSLLDGELAWDNDDARVAWEVSSRRALGSSIAHLLWA